MWEAYYDHVRTKQQLGYFVDSGSRATAFCLGFCFVVKGDAVSPWDAEMRVMSFVESFYERIRDMKPDEFSAYRRAVVLQKLEPDDNMDDQASRYYGEISDGRFCFGRHDVEAKCIVKIDQPSFARWYRERFCESSERRRLVVSVQSSRPLKGYRGATEYRATPELKSVEEEASGKIAVVRIDAMGVGSRKKKTNEEEGTLTFSDVRRIYERHPGVVSLAGASRRSIWEYERGLGV